MRKYIILLIMFAFVGVVQAQEVSISLDSITNGRIHHNGYYTGVTTIGDTSYRDTYRLETNAYDADMSYSYEFGGQGASTSIKGSSGLPIPGINFNERIATETISPTECSGVGAGVEFHVNEIEITTEATPALTYHVDSPFGTGSLSFGFLDTHIANIMIPAETEEGEPTMIREYSKYHSMYFMGGTWTGFETSASKVPDPESGPEGGKLSSIFTLCPWDAARNESLEILP